jgi:hypothetical protein
MAMRMAGRNWMRVAEYRAKWRQVGEAYVQQWTVVADDDNDEIARGLSTCPSGL